MFTCWLHHYSRAMKAVYNCWTGLDWNGGLDQIIVFAHAQTFKRECTFAPALQSTMIIGQHALNDAAMNNVYSMSTMKIHPI